MEPVRDALSKNEFVLVSESEVKSSELAMKIDKSIEEQKTLVNGVGTGPTVGAGVGIVGGVVGGFFGGANGAILGGAYGFDIGNFAGASLERSSFTRRMQLARHSGATHIGDGLSKGVNNMARGVYEGARELVDSPREGFRRRGVVGLGCGIAVGVGKFGGHTFAGAITGAEQVAVGLVNTPLNIYQGTRNKLRTKRSAFPAKLALEDQLVALALCAHRMGTALPVDMRFEIAKWIIPDERAGFVTSDGVETAYEGPINTVKATVINGNIQIFVNLQLEVEQGHRTVSVSGPILEVKGRVSQDSEVACRLVEISFRNRFGWSKAITASSVSPFAQRFTHGGQGYFLQHVTLTRNGKDIPTHIRTIWY